MSAGTVPGVVFYGIQLMNPKFFILYAFVLSAMVSFLLGTSLGTVGTVGIALIVMAKSGSVNPDVAAGAIIAGAYFGDRCSPMSSSANLVANLTGTSLFKNIKIMFKTGFWPLLVSIGLYGLLSFSQPLRFTGVSIDYDISNTFNLGGVVLFPAMIILLLSAFKVNVRLSMLLSILAAVAVSVLTQGYSLFEVLKFSVAGFYLPPANPLATILSGGGILSMWKAAFVVYTSCALAGIFQGTNLLSGIETFFSRPKSRSGLFFNTTAVSLLTGAFGCNQSIATVLTNHIMHSAYQDRQLAQTEIASDLENTGIVLSALIPWNLASFVPTLTLGVSGTHFIPFAFYLYLIPVMTFLSLRLKEHVKEHVGDGSF
jgi:NhaC family Na+:H+ antiporter